MGAHKTATSLIQKFLNNEEGFRKDNQIRHIDRTDSDTLIGLGDKLKKSPFVLRRRLLREGSYGSEGSTVILSHENALGRPFSRASGLYPKANGNAERLSKVAKHLPVKVIFYIRPLETFVTSYYMQSINEGGVLTYKNFNVWFEEYEWGEAFSLGSADDGGCGDSYPTYDEFLAALKAESAASALGV